MRYFLALAATALFVFATPTVAQYSQNGAPESGGVMTSPYGSTMRGDDGTVVDHNRHRSRHSHRGVGDGRGANGHYNVGGPSDF